MRIIIFKLFICLTLFILIICYILKYSNFIFHYQVNIAKLVQPEVINGRRNGLEIIAVETFVSRFHSNAEPAQNPSVHSAFTAHTL